MKATIKEETEEKFPGLKEGLILQIKGFVPSMGKINKIYIDQALNISCIHFMYKENYGELERRNILHVGGDPLLTPKSPYKMTGETSKILRMSIMT